MTDTLTDLTQRLDRTAAKLRGGELSTDEAASLVEDCARLAADAVLELERLARGSGDPNLPPAQEPLDL